MKKVVYNVVDDKMIIGFFKDTLQKYKIDFRIESTFLIDCMRALNVFDFICHAMTAQSKTCCRCNSV